MNYKKIFRISNISLITLVICFLFPMKVNALDLVNQPTCEQENPKTAKIVSITKDPSAILIQCRQDEVLSKRTIPINTPELNTYLQNLQEGDLVFLEYNVQKTLKSLSVATADSDPVQRIFLGGLIGALLWLIFSFLLQFQNPWMLTLGLDKRYSNSKTQMFSWFFILLTTYISTICLRGLNGGMSFIGGVAIPPNLLLMSGLSAFSFAAAKGITQSKVNEKEKEDNNKEKIKEADPQNAKFPYDLFHNDKGDIDLGDFQMIVITAIAIVVYGFQVYDFLGKIEFHKVVTLPEIDSTLLASFGIGQGAYLAKKIVGNLGES